MNISVIVPTHNRKVMPKVSVIIVTYNNQETIEENLKSVLNQSYPKEKLEIIYIDSSKDKTTKILKNYSQQMHYFYQPKKGIPAARNLGIKKSSGEIIAFTDGDCFPRSNWVYTMVKELMKSPSIGAVGGSLPGCKPKSDLEKFLANFISNHQSNLSGEKPYFSTANIAFQKNILKKIKFFDERLISGEDADICWRLVSAGYHLVYCPQAIVYYKDRDNIWDLTSQCFRDGRGWAKLEEKYCLKTNRAYEMVKRNLAIILGIRKKSPQKNRYKINFPKKMLFYFFSQMSFFSGLIFEQYFFKFKKK